MCTSFINHRLCLVVRFLTVVGVGLIVCLPTGCRGTRSTVGQLPGLGWVSPDGDDVQFESWNESETASISTPADEATPQVAMREATRRSKSSADESTMRRESYPLADTDSDADSDAEASGNVPPTEYPDTGYPSPRELQLAKADDRYPTVAADEVAIAGRQVDRAPQRGFYNQGDYEDVVDDTIDQPGPSRYSRFSMTEPDEDLSNDTLPANDGVNDSVEPYAKDATAITGGSRWSHTVDNASLQTQTADLTSAGEERFVSSDDPPLDSDASLSDRATEYAKGAVSRFGQQINDAGADLRGGVDRFADSTRGAVEVAQEKLGAATEPLTNGYDSGALSEPSLNELEDASKNYGEFTSDQRADDLNAGAPYNELPPAYEEPATKSTPRPWRPGSTSTYDGLNNDDQSRRSTRGVAPASFPTEYQSDRRFAPSYR